MKDMVKISNGLILWSFILGSLGGLLFTSPLSAEDRLTLLTEENPPYNYVDPESGELEGLSLKIVRKIMADTDIPHDYVLLPWPRAFARAQTDANSCIFIINQTEDRAPLFEWVATLGVGGWAFFARPDFNVPENITLDDLFKARIAALRGSATLDQLRETGANTVLEARSGEDAIKMLYRGRVDYLIAGTENADHLAYMYGFEPPQFVKLWQESRGMLACSKATRPDWLAKLKAAAITHDAGVTP